LFLIANRISGFAVLKSGFLFYYTYQVFTEIQVIEDDYSFYPIENKE
jgi:hypothetical protein